MIGRTLGRYRVLERVGAGGMGEVYRARDEHLGRDVAIKVLPEGRVGDEAARRRFRKEALALAKLNHPHIATVFDFASCDGMDLLVTEFVPGTNLAQKLAQGALPEGEVLWLGHQLAEGLAAAHAQGVVHRDLKPANLSVTPDRLLKILDFGVAKLFSPAADAAPTETLTETEAAAGTLPYMAPEQLRGHSVGLGADIWAAGAVLYEMSTGRRPFEARLTTALAADIQHKPVTPPRQLNPRISPRLEEIILKCLEKDPENRYQSAKELAVDLRRLAQPGTATAAVARGSRRVQTIGRAAAGVLAVVVLAVALNVGGVRERLTGGAATPRITSLAVLPLKNLSGDPGQEYFVEGMHEALTTELSKISALKVISRTSAVRYKDTDKALPQIARELGVEGLVEGSVLREGDQVRVTVQLVHGASDRHLWAENYHKEVRGVLALQSEIARAIAREIQIAITPAEEARLAHSRTVNPEAHELYLRGRFHGDKRTRDGLQKGLEYFQAALDIDPGYALAYVGLADSYRLLGNYYGALPPREALPKARTALNRALQLDDTLAEAHASVALSYRQEDWNWEASEKEFQRAIELNPNYATTHHWYALTLSALGRHEEARQVIKRARELDPLSSIIRGSEVMILFNARRYDQVIEEGLKAIEVDPGFVWFYGWVGSAYLEKGMLEQGIEQFKRHAAVSKGDPAAQARLGYAYGRAGRRREALNIARELEALSQQTYVSSFHMALVYLGLGEKSQALEWLEMAYANRDSGHLLSHLNELAWFDPLRGEPRFQALLRQMNFPPAR